MKTLAQLLRAARHKRGWSLEEAAGRLGIVKGHLWELENEGRGQMNPTLSTIAAIAYVYKISPRAIVDTVLSDKTTPIK